MTTSTFVSAQGPPQQSTLLLQCLYTNYPVSTSEAITIVGSLTPARSGPVTLYWSINGSGFIYTWSGTFTDGSVSRTFGFSTPGEWGFRLVWAGDAESTAATSNEIYITVVSSQAEADNWAMFSHDLIRSGHSSSLAPNTNQTSWSYTTPSYVRASPAIVNGVVYAGSFGGKIYALDAVKGVELWSYMAGDHIWSSPAVANGVVYVGSNDFNLYALSAATGALLWSFNTGGAVFSSPAAWYGRVYIGSTDNRVYALEAGTGAQVWNYTTGGQVRSSPAVAGEVLYIVSQDGYVYALNAYTGSLIWRSMTAPGDSYTTSSPAVSGGRVYVGAWDGYLYAFSASTGSLLWRYNTGGIVESSPAIAGNTVYVGSDGGSLYALDATTGALRWSFPAGSQVYSSPAVASGTVYFGTWGGYIYALDASSGALRWSYRTGSGVFSSPAVSNGLVCIGSYDYKLYAFGTYSASYYPPRGAEEGTWTPPSESAVGAAVVAGAATAVAAAASATSASPLGGIAERIGERIKDFLPTNLKKWVEYFVLSKRKLKLESKSGSLFMPTAGELIAYAVAIVFLAVTFAYAKAGSIAEWVSILPVYFATGIVVGLVKRYFTITFLRTRGVWAEHKVWLFGLALLLVTTVAFRVPFSTPTRNVKSSDKYTGRLGAMVAASWVLIGLAFAGLFALLIPLGYAAVGSAGLAMCIVGALFDTFPIPPLVGKDLFDQSKPMWAALFASTLIIYMAWLLLL